MQPKNWALDRTKTSLESPGSSRKVGPFFISSSFFLYQPDFGVQRWLLMLLTSNVTPSYVQLFCLAVHPSVCFSQSFSGRKPYWPTPSPGTCGQVAVLCWWNTDAGSPLLLIENGRQAGGSFLAGYCPQKLPTTRGNNLSLSSYFLVTRRPFWGHCFAKRTHWGPPDIDATGLSLVFIRSICSFTNHNSLTCV